MQNYLTTGHQRRSVLTAGSFQNMKKPQFQHGEQPQVSVQEIHSERTSRVPRRGAGDRKTPSGGSTGLKESSMRPSQHKLLKSDFWFQHVQTLIESLKPPLSKDLRSTEAGEGSLTLLLRGLFGRFLLERVYGSGVSPTAFLRFTTVL